MTTPERPGTSSDRASRRRSLTAHSGGGAVVPKGEALAPASLPVTAGKRLLRHGPGRVGLAVERVPGSGVDALARAGNEVVPAAAAGVVAAELRDQALVAEEQTTAAVLGPEVFHSRVRRRWEVGASVWGWWRAAGPHRKAGSVTTSDWLAAWLGAAGLLAAAGAATLGVGYSSNPPSWGRALRVGGAVLVVAGVLVGLVGIVFRPQELGSSSGGSTATGSPGAGSDQGPASPSSSSGVGTAASATARRVQVIVDDRVTNGAGMREDASPAYLSLRPRNYCKSNGCAIPGTDYHSGATATAVCQTQGERVTNGDDASPADDANPDLYTSTLWYGVIGPDGRVGYLSEVWVAVAYRGGQGLPTC